MASNITCIHALRVCQRINALNKIVTDKSAIFVSYQTIQILKFTPCPITDVLSADMKQAQLDKNFDTVFSIELI